MTDPAPRPPLSATPVPWRWLGAAAAVVLVAAAAVWLSRVGVVSEEAVRSTVLTTIASEAPERFLVTGTLRSGLSSESARRWRVRALDIEAGRATVRVEVPGRMSYGFSLDALAPSDIRFRSDGVVEIRMPPLSVFSVEPVLDSARVSVDATGLGRFSPDLAARTMENTLHRVRPALRRQAQAHLDTAAQPQANAARALAQMLQTPLQAAGVRDARFRFVLAGGDTLTLGADGGSVRALGPSETPRPR